MDVTLLLSSGWIVGKSSAKEQCCSGTAACGVVWSPSLGVSQSRGDVALRDVGSGHGGVGGVGFGDPRELLQP